MRSDSTCPGSPRRDGPRPLRRRLAPLIASLIFLCALPAAAAEAPGGESAAVSSLAAPDWPLVPIPDWVEPIDAFETRFDADAEPGTDVDYRLFERQVDLRDSRAPVDWRAVEREFLSRDGVHDASRLEVVFDPAYQRVRLHELEILRGGTRTDRRASARVDLLHREPDLEAATFDGRRTLSILLSDVRVGDVLRASWSIVGANPVFDGHYESSFSTTLDGARQARRRLRVLSPSVRPLRVRTAGPDVVPDRSLSDGTETTVLDLAAIEPRYVDDDDDPEGPYGLAVFGTVADWSEIVALEAPLYDVRAEAAPELATVAARIRAEHADVHARTGAALRWVQTEIRYFGMQLGQHSHRPAGVSETLARRFADCKGKTLLLMTLLHELGIESAPALVETDGLHLDPDQPWRLHAFDHVVVALSVDGTRHYIDPTKDDQRGPLGDFHEPDHQRALVLSPGVVELEPMGGERSGQYVDVLNAFDVPRDPSAPTTFTVTTVKRGSRAEDTRRWLRQSGRAAVAKVWFEYYADRWPGIGVGSPVEIDEGADGALTTVERYSVPDFWGDDGARTLVADTLTSDWLALPDADADRPGLPTRLAWPAEIVERWRVALPEPVRTAGLGGEIDTPWYRVEETSAFDVATNVLEVTQRYTARAPHVADASRDAFEAPAGEMEALLDFTLEDARPRPAWLQSVLDSLAESDEPATLSADETAQVWAAVLALPCFLTWGGLRHRRNLRSRGKHVRAVEREHVRPRERRSDAPPA